jgi:predicted transposase YbfD/YdcC
MLQPLLDTIPDIQGKTITADALLTQRSIARYLVEKRQAHYLFTVKGNQKTLLEDLKLFFQDRQKPDWVDHNPLEHGRIDTRKIWTTSELNPYLDFPHVGQAFIIERHSVKKKTGKETLDVAYGITSQPPEQATAKDLLTINRGHWTIENSCHYIIDWNYDEDRSTIRTGNGPANITRLRRFAVGILKSKGVSCVAQKMRHLSWNVRTVFDYLRMTRNSAATCSNNSS